ncbi:hypothetical protein CANARDRAFT_22473 [[Candida] arabinofermentans NRRL YB-2248]|uniref:Mrp8p n=1 Tax=[Candida] arabinofermentans NRRL YB-2248 TaxID=983967 RepID=A0A1E4T1P2_9ASCO|nr:hypothetical protein CANARDRAFT_22473 [[Candida] arabinofermentans NRRL YB-2248]
MSLEELQTEVENLKALVSRQKKMLANTGEQLLQLQVKDTQAQLKSIDIPKLREDGTTIPAGSSDIDTSEFATNDDIIQLVGELQGQLNILEQRSLRRTINSTLVHGEERVAPIPNSDGDEPSQSIYPHNLDGFKDLSDDSMLALCAFYELLPPTTEEEARMAAFLEGKIKTPNLDPSEFTPSADDYSKETLDELYDELARFLGLKVRRGENAW